jgi:hypothetical protein
MEALLHSSIGIALKDLVLFLWQDSVLTSGEELPSKRIFCSFVSP